MGSLSPALLMIEAVQVWLVLAVVARGVTRTGPLPVWARPWIPLLEFVRREFSARRGGVDASALIVFLGLQWMAWFTAALSGGGA